MPGPDHGQAQQEVQGHRLRHEDGRPALGRAHLAVAAQLLGRPLPTVERAARKVEPYRHADGSPRWSLRELAKALSLVESREAGRRAAS
jgi:hypothetical protein